MYGVSRNTARVYTGCVWAINSGDAASGQRVRQSLHYCTKDVFPGTFLLLNDACRSLYKRIFFLPYMIILSRER